MFLIDSGPSQSASVKKSVGRGSVSCGCDCLGLCIWRPLRTLGSDCTIVTCTGGGLTKELMPNEPRLLDLLAAARDRNGRLMRTIAKCSRQHKCGTLGAVGHCEVFEPVLVHRAKMDEKDIVDKMGVYDIVPRSDAAAKGCRVIRTRWGMANKGSDEKPQFRTRWVSWFGRS